MRIFGLTMVRDEVDIIRTTILYYLAQGLDRILIVDNGSTDGTIAELQQLSRDPRVSWTSDLSGYYQQEIMTELAHEARRQGADWLIPFDADEFWYVHNGDLRTLLATTTAGALSGQVVHYVQSRRQLTSSSTSLLTMTYRAHQLAVPEQAEAAVANNTVSYVQTSYVPKWLLRPTETLIIAKGNHAAVNAAPPHEAPAALVVLHAPLRSRADLDKRAAVNERSKTIGRPPGESWQLQRWADLHAARLLDAEWSANSYHDGCLNVYGEYYPLVYDPLLRDTVAPLITPRRSRLATWRQQLTRH